MELLNDVFNSVDKYFTTLSHTGYISYKRVEELLVYTFIEELLNTMSEYIDDKDYTIIMNSLECLYGTSCTIPYPVYIQTVSNIEKSEPDSIRITETDIIRFKDSSTRIVS